MDFEEIKKKRKSKLINNGLQAELTVIIIRKKCINNRLRAELTIIIHRKNALICHFFLFNE